MALLAGQQPAAAAAPFNPTFDFSVSNANTGARASVALVHSVPSGNQMIGSVNTFLPGQWQVASGSTYPPGERVGHVSMKVHEKDFLLNCTGTEQTLSGDLINDALDPLDPDQADWHANLGPIWVLDFAVTSAIDPDTLATEWVISVTPGNASMPFLLCAPQDFNVLICGVSASGKQVIANPTAASTYTIDGILSGKDDGSLATVTKNVVIGSDSDNDGLANTVDPSPNTPNPNAAAPNDSDCDGDSLGLSRTQSGGGCPTGGVSLPDFRDCIEGFVGTDPVRRCSATPTLNDEAFDAMPADFNDDQRINVTDRTLMVLAMKNQIATPPVYNQRYDLSADGAISSTDRTIVVIYIKASGSVACP